MKKIIYYFMVFLCGFTCLAGVSLFFINEDSVQNFMVKSLKLKNDISEIKYGESVTPEVIGIGNMMGNVNEYLLNTIKK